MEPRIWDLVRHLPSGRVARIVGCHQDPWGRYHLTAREKDHRGWMTNGMADEFTLLERSTMTEKKMDRMSNAQVNADLFSWDDARTDEGVPYATWVPA